MDKCDVTVMMVTYNRLDLTKITFQTTMRNTGCDYNLVVIDNNSSDETIEWIQEEVGKIANIKNFELRSMDKNMGIGYGRNMGLFVYDECFSDCKYLCTLDNDVVLQENWLIDCCNTLAYSKNIGACGVNLEGVDYSKTTLHGETIQIKPRGNLGTAAMVFPKIAHTKLGFFCNDYAMYAHEDADWGFRLRMIYKILAYLGEQGNHIGVGENDSGEYRKMKDKYWDINMPKYNKNINNYIQGTKSIYIDFKPK